MLTLTLSIKYRTIVTRTLALDPSLSLTLPCTDILNMRLLARRNTPYKHLKLYCNASNVSILTRLARIICASSTESLDLMSTVSSQSTSTLKAGPFGTIEITADQRAICRDTDRATRWAGAIARHLARREARALIVLNGLPGIPRLIDWNGRQLLRDWLAGEPLHAALPVNPTYFREALRLLRRIHSRNIAHNDLAKEANCLVLNSGQPGFIDFQLALHAPQRGYLFRLLAREDLRHLLKHKRCYCPEYLTARQHRILANPSLAAKLWMRGYKPLYLWVTRSILGWPERDGAAERIFNETLD